MRTIGKGKRKRLLCLMLSLCCLLGTLGGVLLKNLSDTLAMPETVSADSISGSLWAEEGETPLAGYPVYLYKAEEEALPGEEETLPGEEEEDLPGETGEALPEEDEALPEGEAQAPAPGDSFNFDAPFARTLTGADGAYRFEGLAPDHYVVGIALGEAGSPEEPAQVTDGSAFAAGEGSGGQPMAFSEVIELVEGEAVTDISAGVLLGQAPRAGNSYTIDVNDYSALSSSGNAAKGYSFDSASRTLTFTTLANGNNYSIIRTQSGVGMVGSIVFGPGVSPASVSFNGLYLTGGITFPQGFNTPLGFSRYLDQDVEIAAALTLPANYNAPLWINGLKAPGLTFPAGYNQPLTFNGLTITGNNGLKYPTGYNLPITIAANFNVNGAQFPAGYKGPITIGGGTFTGANLICKPDTSVTPGTNAVILPNNIAELTMNDAKTGKDSSLFLQLGASDDFTLWLSGESDIKGHIGVPPNAKLTIDSKAEPGSENGRLAIESRDMYACIGYYNVSDAGQITINGGTVEAKQMIDDAQYSHPAAIGSGAGKTGYVTINGGKVTAKGNLKGAAIGGGQGGNGNVAISGGTVNAMAGDRGAAIGGGESSKGGKILITGGTVVATAGDMSSIQLGGTASLGAGIGSGTLGYFESIEITGGHVTANSGRGAGIGTGGCSAQESGNISFGNLVKGAISITGGTIRGYTNVGANIGKGFGSSYGDQSRPGDAYIPKYRINKEADIYMCCRGNTDLYPGVECAGGNLGDGYFVSVQETQIKNNGKDCAKRIQGDIYVYNVEANGKTGSLARKLDIPHGDVVYMTFLFSTGHNYKETFHIFTDFYNDYNQYVGMRQYMHHWDHLPPPASPPHQKKDTAIPSIKDLNGTDSYQHQFKNDHINALLVCFGEGGGSGVGPAYYRVTEIYVDTNGERIRADHGETFLAGSIYNGHAPAIDGYTYKGFKWDDKPENPTDYTAGDPQAYTVNANKTIYYVYAGIPAGVSVELTKVDAMDTEAGLAGAQFKAYKLLCADSGHNHAVDLEDTVDLENPGPCWAALTEAGAEQVFTSGAGGSFSLGALANGYYMLVEVKAPEGFERPVGQWLMEVRASNPDNAQEGYKLNFASRSKGAMPNAVIREPQADGGFAYKIVNARPIALPLSGSGGTLPYILGGALLLALSLAAAMIRRRGRRCHGG
ncbi:MAG: SpaA isopeptide-forming pilin-related protein [Oscillospiraceae bacterium]|nr:SpaA isopeptide-forming pilin-related protein [Oscillospiraceae bacterium]